VNVLKDGLLSEGLGEDVIGGLVSNVSKYRSLS
jgi:hypothetical protein